MDQSALLTEVTLFKKSKLTRKTEYLRLFLIIGPLHLFSTSIFYFQFSKISIFYFRHEKRRLNLQKKFIKQYNVLFTHLGQNTAKYKIQLLHAETKKQNCFIPL